MIFGEEIDVNMGIIRPKQLDIIPIDDTVVLCNSCNGNIYSKDKETFGWLIYLDKRDVKADRPYDFYCDDCTKRSFPKAIEIPPFDTCGKMSLDICIDKGCPNIYSNDGYQTLHCKLSPI